jgi:hypothetical protein
VSTFAQTAGSNRQTLQASPPKQEARHEADLFRQYAHEAARSSSKATSQEEKDTLWAQAALMSERVLGSSFIPSPHYPSLKETHPVL